MIGSILNIWCGTPSAPPTTLDHPTGLTRAGLLRLGAAGLVAAGIGPIAGEALATGRRRIAPVLDIDRVYDVWQQRFNAADLAGIVDLYVADVTHINPEGKALPGIAGVRADSAAAFAAKPQIDIHDRRHLLYGDIALTTNHWTLRLTQPDGSPQQLTGAGIEVMRRPRAGGWRYIVDDASRSAV